MKIQLWDSFNFSETSELFNQIKKVGVGVVDEFEGQDELSSFKMFQDFGEVTENKNIANVQEIAEPAIKSNDLNISKRENLPDTIKEYSGEVDSLENALSGMCKRGGFKGAVIADHDGLPIAVFNSPVNDEILAAYTTILGESLEKAASFLNQPDANNISLDINIMDKIVLRKFKINDNSYYIMIILAQDIDERAEVEILISQIGNFINA